MCVCVSVSMAERSRPVSLQASEEGVVEVRTEGWLFYSATPRPHVDMVRSVRTETVSDGAWDPEHPHVTIMS